MRKTLLVLAAVALAACASEQSQQQHVDIDRRPPGCPSYSAADLEAARDVLAETAEPDDDDDTFVVLASQSDPFAMIVARHDGSVQPIDHSADSGMDDDSLQLFVQPGDLAVGNFVHDDADIESVRLLRKQAVHIAGCKR